MSSSGPPHALGKAILNKPARRINAMASSVRRRSFANLSASSSMIGPIVRAFEMIASESTGERSCIELLPCKAADFRPSAFLPDASSAVEPRRRAARGLGRDNHDGRDQADRNEGLRGGPLSLSH